MTFADDLDAGFALTPRFTARLLGYDLAFRCEGVRSRL